MKKLFYATLPQKANTKKRAKAKTKQHLNEPALNDTVSGSLCKEVKLLLLKKKQGFYGLHQA